MKPQSKSHKASCRKREEAFDLGNKLQAYRRNGVKEYIVWQVFENQLDWYQLVDGEYRSLYPDPDSIIRSQTFPGLWLAVDNLLNNQMVRVLTVLQKGLQSPKHAAFVEWLKERESFK